MGTIAPKYSKIAVFLLPEADTINRLKIKFGMYMSTVSRQIRSKLVRGLAQEPQIMKIL